MLWSPGSFEHGRCTSSSSGNPTDTFQLEHVIDGRALARLWLSHLPDEVVQRVRVSGIRHEPWWLGQRRVLGGAKVGGCDGGTGHARDCFFKTRRDTCSWRIGVHSGTCRKTGDVAEITVSQCLPGRSILGKLDIGGNLEDDKP